jgi:site-specific recombinase XerD
MKQLLAACDCTRDLAIISTLWSTGCRRAELLGMKIENVNWHERTVRVIGKGDKERLVPLTPSAAKTLEKYVGVRACGAIFLIMRCSGQEKALGPRDLDRVIKKVCLRAGINATHSHAFRHTFATHMLEGGADLITVKEFLGHSTIISTQVYAHTSAKFMRETMTRCHPAWHTEGAANAQAK